MNRRSVEFRRLAILLIVGLVLVPGQAQGLYTEAPHWLRVDDGNVNIPIGLGTGATGGYPVSGLQAGAISLSGLENLRPDLPSSIANPVIRVGLISSGVDTSRGPDD